LPPDPGPKPYVLALIPARGGSKGIPRKNVMPLLGKPMIAYSIRHALDSKRIDRVIVTTDDDEIAAVSLEWGAEVPFRRPAELAGDLSPDIDAFRHALEWLREHEGTLPEMVVHLRPPGPVRRVELVDAAVELLRAHPEADAVRSVRPAQQTPYKMWHLTEAGYLEPILRVRGLPDCQSVPRQMLPMAYWQSGYVDVVRPRAILEKNSMWGDCALPFIVDEPLFEIDYPDDVAAVEEALAQLKRGELPHHAGEARQVRHPV
jgi:N-acylneuraminate cytidylyltransferase